MANPSLQIGNGKWAIKEDSLLGYTELGNNIAPVEIDMTRASAGTRVNSSGLVETVELLGSEDVVNEDFATDLSGWIDSTSDTFEQVSSWQGESGLMHIVTSAANRGARQTSVYTLGVLHKFTAKLWIVSGGVYFGKSTDKIGGVDYTTIGEWIDISVSFNPTADSTLRAYTVGSGEFYLDNISVKESTVNNLARVNYTGSTSSLLAEPMRTNLVTYSEDFSQWLKSSGMAVTLNDSTSPSGDINATLLAPSNANDLIYTNVSSTIASTTSIYVKWKVGSGNIDLSSDGGYNYTSLPVTDGWTRISISPTTIANQVVLKIPTSGSELWVWGGQLEQGSYATSYIPTSGNTVTRVQDQFTKTGISDKINTSEGVLFCEFKTPDTSDYSLLSINDGGDDNTVVIGAEGVGGLIFAGARVDGNYAVLYQGGSAYAYNKVAVKYKSGDYAVWVNGTEVLTSSSTDISSVDYTNLAFNFGGGSYKFEGEVKQLQVFKTALTDSELAILTT